jgi:heptosyltransferase II
LKKILIIQTASLGDVILSTPLIEKLNHFYPDSIIDFLLKYGNENILRYHPFVHKVIVWDKSEKKYKHLYQLIKVIRERKYDMVINVHRFASSGLITAFSGASIKVGFNKNPFSIFFSKRIKHKIGRGENFLHESERNLKLIEGLTNSDKYPVKLYPSKQDYAKVSQYKTRQFITIAPGSLWFTKQLPEEKWVEFVKSVDEELVVYFLGSPSEKDLCDRIIKSSGHKNNINLAGKFSFLESAALMQDAKMNYVNDSAPMHLASGVNAPTTAIYCSTVPEFGFGPLSEKANIVQAIDPPSCKPCGLHGFKKCPQKHFDCARKIEIDQLLETL